MRFLITAIATVFILVSQTNAQERLVQMNEAQMKEIQKAASESLATFNGLITKENFKQMGFESLEEVREAALGEPLQDFMVRLDRLKEFKSGDDPNLMLSNGTRVNYPVLVKGQLRSSVTLGEANGRWKAVSFGGSNFIHLADRVRKESAEDGRSAASSYFVVRVPALNLFFLGHKADNVLMLTPLRDDSRFEFKAGVSMTADKAFTAIVPAAREHNGLPR